MLLVNWSGVIFGSRFFNGRAPGKMSPDDGSGQTDLLLKLIGLIQAAFQQCIRYARSFLVNNKCVLNNSISNNNSDLPGVDKNYFTLEIFSAGKRKEKTTMKNES